MITDHQCPVDINVAIIIKAANQLGRQRGPSADWHIGAAIGVKGGAVSQGQKLAQAAVGIPPVA